MSKHTPGPWELRLRERKRPHGEASTIEGSLRRSGSMPVEVVARIDFGYGRAVDEANARLIAAAPEMYEALKALASDVGHSQDCPARRSKYAACTPCAQARARAAIAKAEG